MAEVISVHELTKKFNGFTAVDQISFSVNEGEIFGFLGPNGAGKTTTINVLTTQLRPTAGTATIAGFDVAKDANAVRKSVGIIFQDPSLDTELTAWENLKFHGMLYGVPIKEIRERSLQLLEMVKLTDRRMHIVKNFSGGMKRRLEIARGLLHSPRVLFLDEPTLGLDPQAKTRIWEYIFRIQREHAMTIFLTTHAMDEAEYCSRIAVIDHGKIITLDTPGALKTKTGEATMNGVFLALTGRDFRDEEGYDPKDKIRKDLRLRH